MQNRIEQYILAHAELMREWKDKHKAVGYESFVTDGIVCPEVWFSQTTRVLFILKEAYNDERSRGVDWCLLDYLMSEDGSKGRIWTAVAEWQYALQNTTNRDIPVFDGWLGCPVGDMKQYRKARGNLLKQCSVINIKKSNGRNGSDDADLLRYVKEDWELIKTQIELIDPTIIVCGSTFSLLRDWTADPEQKRTQIFGVDTAYIPDSRGCYAIGSRALLAYYHPANQYPAALNFYGIVGMYHNYLKQEGCSRS